ncbi:MAG TPA: GDP-L-fucose synthase [Lentimicrobium sp.]|nr:GDP-L-fucose synthase [Lentimicrobium sp.]
MDSNSKIFVAGHRGLVGSAIYRNLTDKGYTNLITKTHQELDLKDFKAVSDFFQKEKPEYVFLAAAKVGGIMANNIYRAQFIFENLQIQNNVIHLSYLNGVKKLLFLGSSCVYPKSAQQPIKEEYLLTDVLEYTNEPYAIAKIAGMKMCESYNLQYGTNFISVMPTNLYGPNDNFHLQNSHVLPGLIRKMHLSKLLLAGDFDALRKDLGYILSDKNDEFKNDRDIITLLEKNGISAENESGKVNVVLKIWGSGSPQREFLWSDDMADACVYIMENLDFKNLTSDSIKEVRNSHINIGSGKEITIRDLAFMIKEIVDFNGKLEFDITKPDGTMRKLLDISRLKQLGWSPKMELKEGITELYNIYVSQN